MPYSLVGVATFQVVDVHDMAGMASPSPEVLATEERHGVIRPIVAYMEK